ncbi:hypothetical protein M434DRAFT_29562 [Hypoxylon sp. CO27-5]|nr:hypothetical protein M434DRAFT_29562 [Hypoxylon sp. CO27-5]
MVLYPRVSAAPLVGTLEHLLARGSSFNTSPPGGTSMAVLTAYGHVDATHYLPGARDEVIHCAQESYLCRTPEVEIQVLIEGPICLASGPHVLENLTVALTRLPRSFPGCSNGIFVMRPLCYDSFPYASFIKVGTSKGVSQAVLTRRLARHSASYLLNRSRRTSARHHSAIRLASISPHVNDRQDADADTGLALLCYPSGVITNVISFPSPPAELRYPICDARPGVQSQQLG